MSTPKRILLTGGRTFTALEQARLFARQGHQVYLAESIKFPAARFSNCITGYIRVPEARFRPREYINALQNIIVKERIDVCIPNLEEIFYIARLAARLPPSCDVWVDTFDKLDRLHNKWSFIEYIKTIGFQTPRTELGTSRKNLISRLKEFSSEKVVVKPTYSRFSSQALIWNRGDSLPRSIQPTMTQQWVAQEFISGRHLCTYSLARNGRVLAHCIYASQQQWGINIGSSTVFECVNNVNAQKWVESFIDKTKFTGQIGFDFIETSDGILYAIECNPRATSGIHLFSKTPELVDQFLDGQNNTIVVPKSGDIRSVKFWLCVRLIRNIFSVRPPQEWKESWRVFRRSSDVLYEKGDHWPVVGHVISLGEVLFQCVRLGISPVEASVYDCNYNGIDESVEQVSRKLSRKQGACRSDLRFD